MVWSTDLANRVHPAVSVHDSVPHRQPNHKLRQGAADLRQHSFDRVVVRDGPPFVVQDRQLHLLGPRDADDVRPSAHRWSGPRPFPSPRSRPQCRHRRRTRPPPSTCQATGPSDASPPRPSPQPATPPGWAHSSTPQHLGPTGCPPPRPRVFAPRDRSNAATRTTPHQAGAVALLGTSNRPTRGMSVRRDRDTPEHQLRPDRRPAHTRSTRSACGPRSLCRTLYRTRSPWCSASAPLRTDTCTNRSAPPASGAMKPNPRSAS